MKKVFAIILSMLMMFSLCSFAFAKRDDTIVNSSVEVYADGSYGITTIKEYVVDMPDSAKVSNAAKSGSTSYSYYTSSNVLLWKVTLNATFTYNGTTATCTSATPSYTVYNSSWKVTKSTASHSGNTATGSFTAKRYTLGIPVETVNKTLTLTCSPNGTIT